MSDTRDVREKRQFTRSNRGVVIHNATGTVIRRSKTDGQWRAEQPTASGIPARIGTAYRRLSAAQSAVIANLTS
jgi:hypothetical protein